LQQRRSRGIGIPPGSKFRTDELFGASLSLTNGGGIATTRGTVGGGHSGRAEKSANKIKVKPSWINSRFSSNPDAVWRLVRVAQRVFRIEWFCCKKDVPILRTQAALCSA
jgi:hypothetical protein